MRISRLRIENFRNFRDLLIDPFPTPAVIVGENGVGKSNLLHALRLVLDPDLPDRWRRLGADDIHESSGNLDEGVEVTITLDLTDFEADLGAQSELDGAIIATGPYVARLTYRFQPKVADAGEDERPLTPDDYEWGVYAGDSTTREMRRVRDQITLSVLPALRDVEADLASFRRSPLARLLEQLPPDASNIEAAHAAIDTAMTALGKDPNIQTAQGAISHRVVRMAGPQLDVEPTLGFASRQNDGLLRSLQLFVDRSRTRGVAFTSTGTANVLYLGMLLETLTLRRSNDAVVDSFLGVEEPEAHLHPGLQRHLFRHLLSEPTQLILTTHSPHIAAVAKLPSLVLLTYDTDVECTDAYTVRVETLTSREMADLERYLDVTRAECLFARFVILVEGLAESFVIPALARAAGFDLDAYGIVVSSVEGTDFEPYAKLLGNRGLSCPYIVITDGDVTDTAEPGLERGAKLARGRNRRAALAGEGTELRAAHLPSDGQMRQGRNKLVERAASGCCFVGNHTMEVDLAPLIGDEMKTALHELGTSDTLLNQFSNTVEAITEQGPMHEHRKDLLRRINAIGKGRYAQRLAAHVETLDLPDTLLRWLENEEEDPVLESADLLSLPGGYLLSALDRVSEDVRGRPLFQATNDDDE